MGALSIRNVRRSYGNVHILKGIDIEVVAGDFLILVGPSGCGKSTLLNIIAGLDKPTEGTVHIDGRDVTHALPKDRDIAMVFQSYALYPNMNVAQNISFGLEMRNVPKAERDAAIARVSKMLQIEHLLDRKPGQLSGGQRQRVAMGRALARNPTLFLFDEPLSNLDAKLRVEMRAEIKHLHNKAQVTTVYVTHDQVEAMTLGDHIAVMKGGVIEQLGSPDDIYSRPATRFVAEFIGSPAMNIVSGQRAANGFASHGIDLSLNDAQRALVGNGHAEGILYGLRPEALVLADAGLPGTISLLEPTGPETYVLVDTPIGKLMARVPGKVHQAVGDTVRLQWSANDAHLFDARSERRVG
ncbi:MAG: sn-glycerol-3-phosphate ABC transporter ATP-binding protein UgpC [Piscinibacter sp.]|uniref:ABC transporter ATP-binding protein n=1 Tax=Piscinibacter sp. TaxID=1903157 RepID=UPI001B63F824|nr:sn-glycerol-3-phosphate ABC transporter ATP-binding protein UgpC [Piscinibacter sp.]MBP5989274.1 sn-glycerol-3-phosphate ABC transporter ATP-binding protein UgpC [Piscinibacter sp.]MBP6026858.1 sn-glycerol-3-phosphate ABC transporter ATP-binding protein UgpC [Piscinibacter sp.]